MLVLATHGYTDHFAPALAPDIAHEIVPVLSWQMATQPLPENVRKTLLPGRLAMSDTHGDLHFARYDARNRLVTGGALAIGYNGFARLKPRIAARLKRLWPQIGEPTFDHVWNGYISMTTDFLPRAHKLGPGAIGWAGCNGRGVGLAMGLGREMARSLLGADDKDVALPFVEPRPLPFHGVLRRLAPFKVLEYRIRDAMEIS
jgi:glycine/D-amino acid oxidase-like deaminating enzyme